MNNDTPINYSSEIFPEENLKIVVVLCGISGSGKSTFAENYLKEHSIIVSSDKVRGFLWGDENDQSDYSLVFNCVFDICGRCLDAGYNVTVDATSLTEKTRKIIHENLREKCDKFVAVYFQNDLVGALERNKNRSRVVSDHVIERQSIKYQPPTNMEFFHQIVEVKT